MQKYADVCRRMLTYATYADYISFLQARDLLNDHIMPRPSLSDFNNPSLSSKLASAATAAAMTQQVLVYAASSY
jgi:hypothetical protein